MPDFDRRKLVEELHARPFLSMDQKKRIACLVYKETAQEAQDGLREICAFFKKSEPVDARNYFIIDAGTALIKWERHTEFTSYMILTSHGTSNPFSEDIFDNFPKNWREPRNAKLLSSILIAIPEFHSATKPFSDIVDQWRKYFEGESFAAAAVLDDAIMIASDFRLDEKGHTRMLLMPRAGTGEKRIGRVAQRLIEIETYKTASMLALQSARDTHAIISQQEAELSKLMTRLTKDDNDLQSMLDEIIMLSAKTEAKMGEVTYRFSAAKAYSDIVDNRIKVLSEKRIGGLQLFSEFMLRRYQPAMRTVESAWSRLTDFSKRVERAANLLRTRVNVRDTRTQAELLASMNKRSETQLRLQETVEGFSVVAISYYAVSLLAYIVAPIAASMGIGKAWVIATLVVPVILLVRKMVHRIKDRITKS